MSKLYIVLSIAYCMSWMSASWSLLSTGWHRSMPGFAAWLYLSAIQAINTTSASIDGCNSWWNMHVWAPVELLVLQAAIYTSIEALRSKWWMLAGAAAATITIPRGLFRIAAPTLTGRYLAFIAGREWLWIAIACSLVVHQLYLILRPISLRPGVYRLRWLFAWYAVGAAVLGSAWVTDSCDWMVRASIWRGVVTILMVRVSMQRSRMAMCSVAALVPQGRSMHRAA